MDSVIDEQVKSWENQMTAMTMQLPELCDVVADMPPQQFSLASIGGGNSSNVNGVNALSSSCTLSFTNHEAPLPSLSNPNKNFLLTRLGKQNSMREMIFRIAAMQPIQIEPEWVKPPKRRNVKISKDPQSVAARHRRERISERIRILQRLVPGGTKMDTASMLDEAIHYVKFLKTQLQSLERAAAAAANTPPGSTQIGFPLPMPLPKPYHQASPQNLHLYGYY